MKTFVHSTASTLAVLIFVLATTAPGQTATTGSIIIRVKATADLPIANVMLSITSKNLIRSQSVTTNEDGYFRIGNLPPGRYTVVAHIVRDFFTSEAQVDVNIARTSSVTFQVRRRPEVRSTQVRNQPPVNSPRITPNVHSFVASTPVTSSPYETKPQKKRDVALKSEKSVAEPVRTERKPSDDVNMAIGKNVGPAEILPTGSNALNSRRSPRSVDFTQIYRVGVGDILDIKISSTPTDKSNLFTVTSHGLLEHPLLTRQLNVLGLTTDEITTRIEMELKGNTTNQRSDILVAVREYVSHTIIVSGLVKEPGSKILRREAIPLYVVLADAQPLPEAGRASVISKETGEITTVDLSDPKALTLAVCSGDVVSVQVTPKQYFYIGGDVKAPGEKPFRSGLTLTQAILAAGGLSGKAATVQVARAGTNGRLAVTQYRLDDINSGNVPDPVLQQGDRITVTR
jgi:polysaccharide export outer membrane protein